MKLYLARHEAEKTLLGVFFIQSLSELFDMVDDLANPDEYEFQEMGSAAICFEGDEPSVRSSNNDDEDETNIWNGATELGALESALGNMDARPWDKLCVSETRGALEFRLEPGTKGKRRQE